MKHADFGSQPVFSFSREHRNKTVYRVCRHFRKRRYRQLCRLVGLLPEHSVLDIGCGRGYSFEDFNRTNRIVGLDVFPASKLVQENFEYVTGLGSRLPFPDKSFDLVTCIGVLEHVFPFEELKKTAEEIQRVSSAFALVVPHINTFLEPHYHLPYWQHYPERLKSCLVDQVLSKLSSDQKPPGCLTMLNYFHREKWRELFPGARILAHTYVGTLVRNFIIYRPIG